MYVASIHTNVVGNDRLALSTLIKRRLWKGHICALLRDKLYSIVPGEKRAPLTSIWRVPMCALSLQNYTGDQA